LKENKKKRTRIVFCVNSVPARVLYCPLLHLMDLLFKNSRQGYSVVPCSGNDQFSKIHNDSLDCVVADAYSIMVKCSH